MVDKSEFKSPSEDLIKFCGNSDYSFVKGFDGIVQGMMDKLNSDWIINLFRERKPKFYDSDHISLEQLSRMQVLEKLEQTFDELQILKQDKFFAVYEDYFCLFKIDDYDSHIRLSYVVYTYSVKKLEDSLSYIRKLFEDFEKSNNLIHCYIKWFFINARGEMDYSIIKEDMDDIIYPEAYPYLPLERLIYDFIESSSSIFLLVGPPGTGKTRLIRYFLRKMAQKELGNHRIDVMYTCDKTIVERGNIFTSFVFNKNYNVLVLEDVDYHLRPRNEGNHTMYNLLSISDGLAVNHVRDKKVFLSTNLSSTEGIDKALVRPGRCFGITHTRLLTYQEAQGLLKVMEMEEFLLPDKKEFSLSELYKFVNYGVLEKPVLKTIGF